MIRAYAVSAIREAETRAMSDLATAGLDQGELMARAAAGLAEVASARLAKRAAIGGLTSQAGPGGQDGPRGMRGLGPRRIVAMVGAGNNGGDTLYAVASLTRDGAAAVVIAVADSVHEGGLAAAREAGAVVLNTVGAQADSAETVVKAVRAAELVIDGIVGIGGRPGLSPAVEALLGEVSEAAYVLAVDLPSGTDPDGEVPARSCVFADETVTFIAAKPVHLLPATEPAVGRLTVMDIGVDMGEAAKGVQPAVERVTRSDVAGLWPRPGPADDKYSRGVLGIVAGGEGYTGAALLAVTAAVCSGAGMVRYIGPPTPTLLIRAQVPEAVFGAGRVQAWLVGPGVDVSDESSHGRAQRAAAQSAMDSGLPCVVDAGGLELIAEPRSAPTLLTPHAGELATLLSRLDANNTVDRATVTKAPLAHARRLADLTNSTVLLKGTTTLVVSPQPSGLAVRSQADAPSWLATAGSGDVLAGLAGNLLASGLSPQDAGSLAALVHGLAGDASNPGGPVRAVDVAHAIPGVVAALLTRRTTRS